MARYTVENDLGKRITFDWEGTEPPTDSDMEEVFAAAGGAPEKPAYKPPLSPEQQTASITKARQDAVKSLPMGERLAAGVGKGLMDTYAGLGQLATRATDAVGLTDGANKKLTQAYQGERDLYESATQGDVASRVGEIGGNLALGAAIPAGGAAGLVAKAGTKLGGLAGRALASTLGSTSAGLAAEGAALGAAQFAGEGESRAQNAGIGAATGAALPVAGKALKATGTFANKILGKAAQELSGVSEEALRTYGTGFGEGAKSITAASGKQQEIGQKLVKMLDRLDDYLPEKQVVDAALNEMPAVNVANTIKTLGEAQSGGVLKSSRETNAQIKGLIDDLVAAADDQGNIPAAKFREIRIELDELAGDAFGKESNKFVSAVKKARHTMADDLAKTAEASGNPEYAEAMKSMASKFRAADDLKAFLGKSAQTREQRAESFISTLFGKNKEERRKAVQAMGEIFGQDFIQESKLANLAAELGESGKPSLLPRQFTGRAALGPVLSGGLFTGGAGLGAAAIPTALSSPRLAATTLGLADATGRAATRASQALPGTTTQGSRVLGQLLRDEERKRGER